jgi:hypothetical protein
MQSPPTPGAVPSPGFFASLSLWNKIRLTLAGIGLLVTVPFYFYISHRTATNFVMFDNSLEVAGELAIDGKSQGTLGPKQHKMADLSSGSHKMTFTANAKELDSATLEIPKKGDFGYHALYNLGGKGGIAVVTKYYGDDTHFDDKVEMVANGTKLVELPSHIVMKDVDEAFPDSIRTTKNAMSPSVTRVCHVTGKKIGCPGG